MINKTQILSNDFLLREKFKDIEKIIITERLRYNSGNTLATAKSLGIGRSTLWKKLKKYNKITRGGATGESVIESNRVCRICTKDEPCYWVKPDLCSRCAPECENCGTNEEEDEVRESTTRWINGEKSKVSEWLCCQCEQNLYERCDSCEALVDVDSYGEGIPEDYEGESLCPECAAKEFFECSECGNPALAVFGGERLCKECYEEQSDADF